MRISISYVDRAPQTKASARTGCCGLSPAEPALLPVRRHVLGVELGAGLLDAALHRARLLPALSPAELAAEAPAAAHEVLVVPAAAALHVRHVLERDLAALDLGGVDRHEVARLARLVRLLPRGHRARPEAARAA